LRSADAALHLVARLELLIDGYEAMMNSAQKRGESHGACFRGHYIVVLNAKVALKMMQTAFIVDELVIGKVAQGPHTR
jgi:hypothetical protein